MTTLNDKKIILGVCGSIAAYKAALLVRLLVKSGAEVRVLMTDAAKDFISPLTLSTLAKHPVHSSVSDGESWNNHVELGLWADAMIIAPLTATTLGKLANGICDNVIAAVYLSARCPVFFAPAMDLDMWVHPATQANVQKLQSYGNQLVPVAHGELASGLVGLGRMAEPETIVQFLSDSLTKTQDLAGKNVLITAGPTYEPLDPVRFIGNRSTGKMGVAIAEALATRGAQVKLVLGPSKLSTTHAKIQLIRVETAQEMYTEAILGFERQDAAILAAAVADYRPKVVAQQKMKKKSGDLTIELERTIDIAASLGKLKRSDQYLIGFALETNDAEKNALGKLERKNLDAIVLNSLADKGAGFGHDTNKVTILRRDGRKQAFDLKSKQEVAEDIAVVLADLLGRSPR